MEAADVEQALKRPREYFLEDGLWEIVMGLWIGLTVALPMSIGGAAANWSPVVMLLGSLAIRPAVLAAKARWVYPRTGRVTYPDFEQRPPARTSLGLSPATGPVATGVRRGRAALWTVSVAGAVVIPLAVSRRLGDAARRLGFGEAGGHLMVGIILGGCLLFAAWRWRQRRWIALAVTFPLLGVLVASSGMSGEPALAIHSGGLALALVVSGVTAFVSYLRRAPKAPPETDGG
jgi:hypothetical protein